MATAKPPLAVVCVPPVFPATIPVEEPMAMLPLVWLPGLYVVDSPPMATSPLPTA